MTSTRGAEELAVGDLVCAIFHASGSIEGYVYYADDPSRHLVVELLLDGWPSQVRRADLFDRRSPTSSEGGQHGFCFTVPDPCPARHAEVRLANTATILVGPIDLSRQDGEGISALSPGCVQWEGGLVVAGYLDGGTETNTTVRGFIDGAQIFEVSPSGWTHVAHGERRKPVPAFEAHLPPALADGRVHWVYVSTSAGEGLIGSPLQIVAFADGLENRLATEPGLRADRLRGKVYDALVPRSVPFAWLAEWEARFPVRHGSTADGAAIAVIVVGEDGIEDSLASLRETAIPWVLGVLPSDKSLEFDPGHLIAFLETDAATCRTLVFASGGTTFHPQACAHLSDALESKHQGLAFADIVVTQPNGVPLPLAYGSFDWERALEQGAGTALFAMPLDVALGAARDGASNIYDLFFRAIDTLGGVVPTHLPGFLARCPVLQRGYAAASLAKAASAFLDRQGVRASATPTSGVVMPAVRVLRTSSAERVAVLLPVRNDAEGFRRSLDFVRAVQSRHGVELHVIDMASSDPATQRLFKSLTGHHQHAHASRETTNVARALNQLIREVRSRHILFLECGSHFEEADWLDELVGRCLDPDVAAAGPLIADGEIVAAAGLVGGPEFGFAAAFAGAARDTPGYADLLRVARACTALPLAGLLAKRSELLAVGGFDAERFGRHFPSVDIGLKITARGKRMIFTPHARLLVGPAFGRARHDLPGFASELDALRDVWGKAIFDDPFYNPALALGHRPFSSLAWPPRGPSLHSDLDVSHPDTAAG